MRMMSALSPCFYFCYCAKFDIKLITYMHHRFAQYADTGSANFLRHRNHIQLLLVGPNSEIMSEISTTQTVIMELHSQG
jgi:hypothetical protein